MAIGLGTLAAVAVIGVTTWAVYPRTRSAPAPESSAAAPVLSTAATKAPVGKPLDADHTLAEARQRALAWSPEAALVKIHAGPMRSGAVDAATGGVIRVTFAKPADGKLGPRVKVGSERFVVSESVSGIQTAEEKATDEAFTVADPGCGLHQAWRKAVASGVPSSSEPTFSYAHSSKHERAVWHAEAPGDAKLSRTLDGRSCNILTR